MTTPAWRRNVAQPNDGIHIVRRTVRFSDMVQLDDGGDSGGTYFVAPLIHLPPGAVLRVLGVIVREVFDDSVLVAGGCDAYIVDTRPGAIAAGSLAQAALGPELYPFEDFNVIRTPEAPPDFTLLLPGPAAMSVDGYLEAGADGADLAWEFTGPDPAMAGDGTTGILDVYFAVTLPTGSDRIEANPLATAQAAVDVNGVVWYGPGSLASIRLNNDGSVVVNGPANQSLQLLPDGSMSLGHDDVQSLFQILVDGTVQLTLTDGRKLEFKPDTSINLVDSSGTGLQIGASDGHVKLVTWDGVTLDLGSGSVTATASNGLFLDKGAGSIPVVAKSANVALLTRVSQGSIYPLELSGLTGVDGLGLTAPAALDALGLTASDPPTQAELQSVADKLDEVIAFLNLLVQDNVQPVADKLDEAIAHVNDLNGQQVQPTFGKVDEIVAWVSQLELDAQLVADKDDEITNSLRLQ